MAHIHRLIFCALLALLSWLPTSSFASYPATVAPKMTEGGYTRWYGSGGYHSTPDAACNDSTLGYGTRVGAQTFGNVSPGGQIGFQCFVTIPGGEFLNGNVIGDTYAAGSPYCEDSTHYQLASDNSICNLKSEYAGPSADQIRCTAAKDGYDNYTSSDYRPVGGDYCPSSGAGSSCGATVTGGYATVKNGVKSWITEVQYTGSTCTPPTGGTTGSDAPTPCKGQAGTVNGVSVCIPFGPSNPPAETVQQTTKTNSDGSVTKTVNDTSCDGTNCTTKTTSTTTTSSSGGSTPTTTTTNTQDTKPQPTFCQDNPNSSMCKTGSYSAGGCTSPPACDGDAIQCGIARQTWETACALDASTADTSAYDAAKTLRGDQTGTLEGNNTFTVSGSSFDQSAHFVAVGLSDLSITVMGQTVSIPLSQFNSWLAMLGNLAVAITLIVAMRIALGGNLNA